MTPRRMTGASCTEATSEFFPVPDGSFAALLNAPRMRNPLNFGSHPCVPPGIANASSRTVTVPAVSS